MNWLERQVRNTSVARLIAAVLVLIILAMWANSNSRYIRNFFNGPKTINATELININDVEQLATPWVRLTADSVVATGLQQITIRKKHGIEQGRSVSASYYLAGFNDRLLLVRAHEYLDKTLTGELRLMDFDSQDQLLKNAPADERPFMRERLYPLMLDMTGDYKSDGNIAFVIGGIIGAAALVMGFISLMRWRHPKNHPVLTAAAAWGPIDLVSAKIENEFKLSGTIKFSKYSLTPNFFVIKNFFQFEVRHFDDLVWAYKKVTQHKMYYVIPAGKTHALTLHMGPKEFNLTASDTLITNALEQLVKNRPWAFYGYSKDLADAWQKRTQDILQMVMQRKASYK
jgi:hypothetical protein